MKKEKNPNILKVNPWKIILVFLGGFAVLEIVLTLSLFSSLDELFWIFSAILFGFSALFCVISITSTNYEIDKYKLVHRKMGKITEYFWSDILYIDEEFSEKHKMMRFFDKTGREKFLMFDKKHLIYEEALKRVNQITFEELKRRFPNVK